MGEEFSRGLAPYSTLYRTVLYVGPSTAARHKLCSANKAKRRTQIHMYIHCLRHRDSERFWYTFPPVGGGSGWAVLRGCPTHRHAALMFQSGHYACEMHQSSTRHPMNSCARFSATGPLTLPHQSSARSNACVVELSWYEARLADQDTARCLLILFSPPMSGTGAAASSCCCLPAPAAGQR